MDIDILLALMLAALAAGLVDAIAGGGGLITVPALLLAGFDPVAAIATNKVQGTFGVGSATLEFARRGLVEWRAIRLAAAAAFAGSVAGALAVTRLPVHLVQALLPALLVGMALYFALSSRVRDEDARERVSGGAFAATAAPGIGFYDGAFGPGAGSFYMLGLVGLRGQGIVRASAHTKLLNFASNLGALLLYAAAGKLAWGTGLAMAAASVVGACLGAGLAIRHGARLIRPLLVLVCLAVALRLLSDPAHPWRVAAAGLLRH